MKTVWFAALAACAATSGLAQSTIYKHVDDSGRITYSNKPMKGGVVVDLEPLTTIPGSPMGNAAPSPAVASKPMTPARLTVTQQKQPAAMPVAAVITPLPAATALPAPTTLAAIEPKALKPSADELRRRELKDEIVRTEQALEAARSSLSKEQQNPALVAAVRAAQQAENPTPSQLAQFRESIERASGRIRGLQATVAEQEEALEALRKEFEGLKP